MGGSRTETLAPGESFETDNPGEMPRFLPDLPTDTNYNELTPWVIETLRREAEAAGCLGDGKTAPANPKPAAPGAAQPATPPPVSKGDSAARQNAPAPPVDARLHGPPPLANPPPEPALGKPNRTHGGERSSAPAREADPVEPFSGAFTLCQCDLTVATAFLPLGMIRQYRSGAPCFGRYGWVWGHNHNVYLRELTNGDVAHWTRRLSDDLFTAFWAGLAPPRGVFQTLERLPEPGNDYLGNDYLVTAAEGLVWRFARPRGWTDLKRIPLARIEDRRGNALTYHHDSRNRVAEMRDDAGRYLRFGYGHCGLLELVEDSGGRRVEYRHDADIEHLVEVRLPATRDQPQGLRRRYFYGALSAHP